MRRVALTSVGVILVALDMLWLLLLIGPNLPQSWPGAVIATAFTVIGVVLVYSGVRPPARTPEETVQ